MIRPIAGQTADEAPAPAAKRPRLGFLGTGWIGRNRMEAIAADGRADIAALADSSADMLAAAVEIAPAAQQVDGLDALLDLGLDGLVIATPSALHAEQSIRALERGVAVFCQKPLGRNAGEVSAVVAAARAADRLLGADFSYRHTAATAQLRSVLREGGIGDIFAADLVFHNAYGPDKAWFYDKALSGGGCVTDLGVHLVDLALFLLDFPAVQNVQSALFAGGKRLSAPSAEVEDYAVATIGLSSGTVLRLACSWKLHAGREAVISAEFYGSQGGLALRNVDGSFYDFRAERYRGTATEILATPPDAWGGRAAVQWARRLAAGEGFSEEADDFVASAEVLDSIYMG